MEPWFVLWSFFPLRLFSVFINHPCIEYCWGGAPSSYLELLEKLEKWICRTVGPSLAASLEPLAHHQNVTSLSLFYRYYFGRCSSELAQLVPLPFSWGRSTCYSDRLHDFSVTIPRCYKDVYVNGHAWNTVVMSRLVLLVAPLNFWISYRNRYAGLLVLHLLLLLNIWLIVQI